MFRCAAGADTARALNRWLEVAILGVVTGVLPPRPSGITLGLLELVILCTSTGNTPHVLLCPSSPPCFLPPPRFDQANSQHTVFAAAYHVDSLVDALEKDNSFFNCQIEKRKIMLNIEVKCIFYLVDNFSRSASSNV